jgi:hypothetical protein
MGCTRWNIPRFHWGAIRVSGGPAGRNQSLSGACTPNTKIIIRCTVCRGFTLWSRFMQNRNENGVCFRRSLWNMLLMNMTWKNNPRRRRSLMSSRNGSKSTVGICRTILTRTTRWSFARTQQRSWMHLICQQDVLNSLCLSAVAHKDHNTGNEYCDFHFLMAYTDSDF